MRGAPHSGFSRLMVRINAQTSLGTAGRPALPCRTFQAQNNRKPFRCQPMTVDALTTKMLDCHSFQTAHSPEQSISGESVSVASRSAGEYRVDGGERGSQAAAPPGSGRKRKRRPPEPTRGAWTEIEGRTATPNLSI